ncbi:MAG: peroxiredoxin family protein [Chitinophagaceae bacterium]
MNFKYCLTGILLFSLKVFSQEIKPLSVGDKVPAIQIHSIYNYPALQSNLSAHKNKLVILDFMASNCSSCLKLLPHLDSIQPVFGNKLQIFLVTYEKKEKVKKFLQNHPGLKLPIIGEDTLLTKYFPHTFISHEVWIKDGVVIAITHPEYVNTINIETVFAGNKVDWPVKKDLADFDYKKPLINLNIQNSGNNPAGFTYSAFMGNILNVPPRFTELKDSSTNTIRISVINHPIADLYLISRKEFNFPQSHIIYEVKDRHRFIYNPANYFDVWMKENTFSFELLLPLNTSPEKRQQVIQNGLDRYFNLHARFEKRQVDCLVLTRTDSLNWLLKNNIMPAREIKNRKQKYISIDQLVYSLNRTLYGQPVFDETGYNQNSRLELDEGLFQNIPDLKRSLRNYGMKLITEKREVEMFIITEKD